MDGVSSVACSEDGVPFYTLKNVDDVMYIGKGRAKKKKKKKKKIKLLKPSNFIT
jgi:hypothetical protein